MDLKKINWVYILAIAGLVFVIPFLKNKINGSEEYFGIAENQVRSYTKSSEVRIKTVRVKLGQEIKAGDTLMTFLPENLNYKKEDLHHQSRILSLHKQTDKYLLKINLDRLEAEKKNIISEYSIKVTKLIEQKKLADSLALSVTGTITSATRLQTEIQSLESMKTLALQQLQQKIDEATKEYLYTPDVTEEKQASISNEVNRLIEQEKDLVLISDMDGVVGQLDYQAGDAINAFQSIIKIYSLHPTLVTSYISEQYLGKVRFNDSLIIESLTPPFTKITGNVLNLGSRITALPDRLKKLPEVKAWGREIQIEIPIDNQLIQGEKVKVIFPSNTNH